MKFVFKQKVKITGGFYAGYEGIVKSVTQGFGLWSNDYMVSFYTPTSSSDLEDFQVQWIKESHLEVINE